MNRKLVQILYRLAKYAFLAKRIHARHSGLTERSNALLSLFQTTSREVLRELGVETALRGQVDLLRVRRPYIVIGNHCSYLDMLVLGSIYPCLFVSSTERRDDGAIGKLAQYAGTIFVDRLKKSRLPEDIARIAEYTEAGIPIGLYLEGTTSNARELLPFKSSLLAAIEPRDVEVLPICLRYTHANGKPLEGKDFDLVAWYGDMTFFPHFRRLVAQKSIRAELTVLAPIRTRGEMNRKEIARAAEAAIAKAFVTT